MDLKVCITAGAVMLGAGATAQEVKRKDFYTHEASFVSHIYAEGQGGGCAIRLSNGTEKGAITFTKVTPKLVPFTIETIYGHELGTEATHGHRKGDQFEVRVDGEPLASGTVDAGVAPYEGMVGEWQGALLDALAYGKALTWGFAGQDPLITVPIPDNSAMTYALVKCEAYNPNK